MRVILIFYGNKYINYYIYLCEKENVVGSIAPIAFNMDPPIGYIGTFSNFYILLFSSCIR